MMNLKELYVRISSIIENTKAPDRPGRNKKRKGTTMGTKQDQDNVTIVTVDQLLEWGDNYDGDLPELDPGDYATDEELEAADDERRRQYWRLTGTVAISREAWEAWLNRNGVERESECWLSAEGIADRFRALMDDDCDYWPISCRLSYERGDGCEDEYDSIEGAGHYSVIDL